MTFVFQVHARNKRVDPKINWYEAARAMAGFTGATQLGQTRFYLP